jgi:Asp-tRNA(Asn)/Glu-tRNA(Gln) amidotransferase A subunit family amidase
VTHPLTTQLADVDLLGQAELVRRREVAPVELIDATIERVEQLNPTVNAVITPLFDEARAAAEAADPLGAPFAGVPYLVKDIGILANGIRSTFGSSWVADYVPDRDSVLAQRLRGAGLIFVGVTAVPEFAIAASTESRRFGPTRNPWALDRIAGGSSGGAAAAVASGMVAAAHASDGSGSIRIPASCCGLFGLKPSRGRATTAPEPTDPEGQIVQHAVTRTVRDSAALLDVICGSRPGDLFVAPTPDSPFLNAIGRDPGRLRVALSTEPYTHGPVDRACVDAAERAGVLLDRLGHDVCHAAPEIPINAHEIAAVLESAMVSGMLERLEDELGPAAEELPPVMARLRAEGAGLTAVQYLAAEDSMQRIIRRAAALWDDYDLWLTPTLAQPPIELGHLNVASDDVQHFWTTDRWFTPWCPIASWLGHPAATVPLYWSGDGLPVGVQLTGTYGSEGQLFSVCAQLEEAQPWADRRPPVHALNGSPDVGDRHEPTGDHD